MKNMKKLIALACVATMLIPTVAVASPVSSSGGGDSVIENDNSTAPVYESVVLPTTTDSTYDFKIDRDKLLANYDYEGTYDSGSHVYFNTELAAATITYITPSDATTTYALYTKVFNVDTVQTDDANAGTINTSATFITALTALTAPTSATDIDTAKTAIGTGKGYYVWTPDKDKADEGRGKYVLITTDNIENIIEVTGNDTDGWAYALRRDHDSGEFIWDGNIYLEGYAPLAADDAVALVEIDSSTNAITLPTDVNLTEEIYYGATTVADDTTVYTKATAADLVYTPGTTQYKDTSDAATVVNKSTFPIVVSVQINMTNDTGITYSTTDNVADTDTASLYIAIQDDATTPNTKAVENSTATAYYVLAGAKNKTQTYQVTDETVDETGSHVYARYELPNPVYDSQSFTIVADVNEAEAADAGWTAYIDSLTAENPEAVKPSIEVVYSWEKVDETETANTFEDEMGNLYETDGTTGWVDTFTAGCAHTFDNYADTECNDCGATRDGIANPLTFSLSSDKAKYYVSVGTNATISSVNVYDADAYANDNSVSATSTIDTSKFTVSGTGNALITKTDLSAAITTAGTYVIEITASTGTYTVVYTK